MWSGWWNNGGWAMIDQHPSDEIVARMTRVIDRHRAPNPLGVVLLGALGIVVVAAGAWWTAQAVVGGRSGALMLRLALTVAVGVYYWVLSLAVRGPLG